MKKILLIGFVLIVAFACKEEQRYSWEIDDEDIREYLSETGIDAIKHDAGFYYIIERKGTGEFPRLSDNVEVKTLGYTLDSLEIQSDNDPVRMIPLSNSITGWQYGIPLFDIGSKGKLFLPRSFGYGSEVIIFEVEVLQIW